MPHLRGRIAKSDVPRTYVRTTYARTYVRTYASSTVSRHFGAETKNSSVVLSLKYMDWNYSCSMHTHIHTHTHVHTPHTHTSHTTHISHKCLGILNYFRSVERSLTINSEGLSLEAREQQQPSRSGGLLDHQHLFNTPADYV